MTSENPLVSIIINTRNDAEYLGEAIQSAIDQTYSNFEIILYDNASEKIVYDVAINYKDKLIYHRSERFLTLGAARNAAINKAQGELLTFLDADDLFLQDKLEKQVPLFMDKDVGLVYSNTYHLIKENNGWLESERKFYNVGMPSGMVFGELLKINFIPFNTAIFRRSSLSDNQANWFNEKFEFCTDYDLFIRISHKHNISYIDKPLAKWRAHGNNITLKKPYLVSAEKYLMIPRILEYEPGLFVDYKKEVDIFLSEMHLDMGRYFMHLNLRYKAICCVFMSMSSSLTYKNFSILGHYLFPGIQKIKKALLFWK